MDDNLKQQLQAALDAGDAAAMKSLLGAHTADDGGPHAPPPPPPPGGGDSGGGVGG